MSDVLTRDEAALELAILWEDDAERLESLDPNDRAARAMRRCAEQLRTVTDEHAEAWVSHAQVRLRTGRSDSYLYAQYKDLSKEGRARKGRRGWQVQRSAAMAISVRRDHDPLEVVTSPEELADVLLERTRQKAS